MKPIFGFLVVSGGSDLVEMGKKISAIKFNDWSEWVDRLERCPTCKADYHRGIIWNGSEFIGCSTCKGKGFCTVS